VYVLPLPRYPEYFEISNSNIFAQMYRETLPYCEKKWNIELKYAESFMMHAVKVRTQICSYLQYCLFTLCCSVQCKNKVKIY